MITWLVQSAETLPDQFEWLGSAEWDRYNTLKTDKRRRDWLLGRWTAKQLINDAVGPLPLHEIEVTNHDTGEPFFKLDGHTGLGQLTISHSHGHAFCALLREATPVLGADMERVEPRRPVFVDDYFTAEEKRRVAAVSAERQPTLVTAIWSAKEAALKALHKGLSVDTRSVSCLIDMNGLDSAEWQSFEIIIDHYRLPDAPPLFGSWRVWGDFVLTVATDWHDRAMQPCATRRLATR